ncbi:MAG: hypothetical protein ACKN9K_04635, partial [Dolichospermum sp.]
VLIENQADGTVKATLLSLPECQGLGANKEEALNNLIQVFQARKPEIVTLEIVTLEIEPAKTEHPWMKFAGISNCTISLCFSIALTCSNNCSSAASRLEPLALQSKPNTVTIYSSFC